MSRAYRHVPMAPDEYLGRIESDGRVYEERTGPDHYVGRIELETGQIFETRLGPDRLLGRVDLGDGKVYHARMGPDRYLGRVDPDGKCYLHKALAADIYLGRIDEMQSIAHGGAGFLLLVLPKTEEVAEETKESPADDQALPGTLPAAPGGV